MPTKEAGVKPSLPDCCESRLGGAESRRSLSLVPERVKSGKRKIVSRIGTVRVGATLPTVIFRDLRQQMIRKILIGLILALSETREALRSAGDLTSTQSFQG